MDFKPFLLDAIHIIYQLHDIAFGLSKKNNIEEKKSIIRFWVSVHRGAMFKLMKEPGLSSRNL